MNSKKGTEEKPEVAAVRSTKFDLVVSDEKYKAVIQSIKLYRALCRKAFGICALAEMAGANINIKNDMISVSPDRDISRLILNTVFQKEGKAHLYQLREFIFGETPVREGTDNDSSWMSFVWDSLRKDVSSLWTARDPAINASRGWLVLQGIRGIGQFQYRGIGFPAQQKPGITEHKLCLKWDWNIGEVEFGLKSLDGGRYKVWKSLRDEAPDWKLGTLYLSEREGKIFSVISYQKPLQEKVPENDNIMEISFTEDPNRFILLKGSGKFQSDTISAAEIIGYLEQIRTRRVRWEAMREAIGNPRRPWGRKKSFEQVQKVISKNTNHRTDVVQTRNHLWSRKIIDYAQRWECSKIQIQEIPATLLGEPWQWAQFQSFLKYKASEKNIAINIVQ